MPNNKKFSPPKAIIRPRKFVIHGKELTDNYYWLREKNNPQVLEYLEAENIYTEQMMRHTEKFQEQLFLEMKEYIKEDDISAPEKAEKFFYYSRTEKGKQYKTYHRKLDIPDAEDELLIDENELARDQEYFTLGVFKISPNHKLLAYSIDTSGSEEFIIYIKDLTTGQVLDDSISTIRNTHYSLEWAADSQTFYYTVLNEIKQPDKVYRHRIGTDVKKDELLYFEKDKGFYLRLTKSDDKKFIFLILTSMNTSEIHFLLAKEAETKFQIFFHRQNKLEYYIEHWNEKFFIRTNDNAKNFKLMVTPEESTTKENWKEIIPHRNEIMLSDIQIFKNHLVLYEREDGITKIHIINLINNEDFYIDFSELIYKVRRPRPLEPSLIAQEFSTNIIRFHYTSLITPDSVFDYNMDTREKKLIKQVEILGGYDKTNYTTKRVAANATDGTKVYISLIYRKKLMKNSKNPLLLFGYGSYGVSIEPEFSSIRLSLLNRGIIFAIAHIRGGGEMGREWYENGKLLNKKNTFTDFIACAEYLINEKYTSKDKLAINGKSAGGLLMGAVVNMRPDLFKVVIAQVPFLDVINTMFDPSIPLTVQEYEEWGNPEDKKYYDYMKSYSPYDNIEKKDYPHMLITAGINDPRVQYWEPTKWVAKLRGMKTDNNRLLLKTDMNVGHGGKSGRYDYLKEFSFYYTYILDIFNLIE